jgi:hypothetical protein
MSKKCSTCKIVKQKSEFYKDSNRLDGLRSNCKKCVNTIQKLYQQSPEGRKSHNKASLKYSKTDNCRKSQRKYKSNRKKTDPVYRIIENLRARLWATLMGKNKSANTKELLGLVGEELKTYITSLFYKNMNWKNYGKVWHIDHIKPCSSFDLSKPEEQRKCFHYSNLQPLLAKDNLKKSDKLTFNNN